MKRFKNILYVADSAGVVLRAFHHAVGLAERNKARLTVILVMERTPSHLPGRAPKKLLEARTKELQAALDNLAAWAAGRVEVETKIVEGKAFLEIIREVLRNGRDLVIKSIDRHAGAPVWPLVSADMQLLRKCPCPVWLIKPEGPDPIRRVMACVDFNDLDPDGADESEALNRMILEMAGSLAVIEQSDYHVVHVWDTFAEPLMNSRRAGIDEAEIDTYVNEIRLEHRSWLDRLLAKARTWQGSEAAGFPAPTPHLPKGWAGEAIPALARDLNIDLIVMGTVARSGIPGLIIGNTAETVLNQIQCSVLAVKPPDFVTPVTLAD